MLADWAIQNPKVGEWMQRLSKKSAETAKGYASQLHTYWTQFLSKKFSSLEDWVSAVKADSKSDEYEIQSGWARQAEEFVQTYISKVTKRPLSTQARGFTFWAIRNYLAFRLGDRALTDYQPIFAERTHIIAERDKSKDTQTVTLDEIKKIVLAANPRDRAIILCSMWGLGVGEFLAFSKDWYKYKESIEKMVIPIKVTITRPKTGVRFYTEFFDDAVEALHDLLNQRKRELGRDLGENDPLFSVEERSVIKQTIQFQIRYLAESTGVEPRHSEADRGKSYRIRAHEIGRDLFASTARNADIPEHIYNFCMGHTTDPLKYDKSPWSSEGEERIRLELNKIRPKLNVVTHSGQPQDLQELPYLTEAVEWISLFKGLPKDQVEKGILAMLKRSPAFEEALKTYVPATRHLAGWDEDPAREVALGMDRTDIFPSVLSYVQSLTETTAAEKPIQKVIKADELQQYLDEGWSFRSVINTYSVLVEKPKEVT